MLWNEPSHVKPYGVQKFYLNPAVYFFNYSCDSMVCPVVVGDTHALVTLQRIKKGEQVYILLRITFI